MTYIVIALGAIIATGGVLGITMPTLVASFLNISFTPRIRYVLAFSRFTIGTILYFCSHQTKFPITIQIFSMITVLEGIIGLVMNPTTIQRWINRFSLLPPFAFRLVSVLAATLGAFFIYAAL